MMIDNLFNLLLVTGMLWFAVSLVAFSLIFSAMQRLIVETFPVQIAYLASACLALSSIYSLLTRYSKRWGKEVG